MVKQSLVNTGLMRHFAARQEIPTAAVRPRNDIYGGAVQDGTTNINLLSRWAGKRQEEPPARRQSCRQAGGSHYGLAQSFRKRRVPGTLFRLRSKSQSRYVQILSFAARRFSHKTDRPPTVRRTRPLSRYFCSRFNEKASDRPLMHTGERNWPTWLELQ